MQWAPRWSQIEGGLLAQSKGGGLGGAKAHAAGASVVPKRRRPPRPCGGGLGDPKAKEVPSPMCRGPRWSQSGGGPLAHEGGPRCEGGPLPHAVLGGPKAKEAPSPMRHGSRWSQSKGEAHVHAVGASVVPKRRRSPRPSGGVQKRRRPPRPCGGGLGGPKAKEAASPMRWGPRWSQSEGGPLAHAVGASLVPKRRRLRRPCGGGLGGPKAK